MGCAAAASLALGGPSISRATPVHPATHQLLRQSGLEVASSPIYDVFGGPGQGKATTLDQYPVSIARDGDGVLVSDGLYSVIRRLDLSTGIETVVAGTGSNHTDDGTIGPALGDGGLAVAAPLTAPGVVEAAPDGGFTFVDGSRIRHVGPDGVITTIVGDGEVGVSAQDGTPAIASPLVHIMGLGYDPAGELCFAEDQTYDQYTDGMHNGSIRCVNAAGLLHTLIGSMTMPGDFVFETDGSLLFPNLDGGVYRRSPNGSIATVIGAHQDRAEGAWSTDPDTVWVQGTDVAEQANGEIAVAEGWRDEVLAGDGQMHFLPSNAGGWVFPHGNDAGAAYSVIPAAHGWYVADVDQHVVYQVQDDGTVKIVAGDSRLGGDGGPASLAQLVEPRDLGLLPNGSLMVFDEAARQLRALRPNGTAATTYTAEFSQGGAPNRAVIGPDGNTYVFGVQMFLTFVTVVSPSGEFTTKRLPLPNGLPTDISGGIGFTAAGTIILGWHGKLTEQSLDGDLIDWTDEHSPIKSIDSVLATPDEGVLVGDSVTHHVWFIGHPGARPVVVAGSGAPQGSATDPQGVPARDADISDPIGLAFDPVGDVLVADQAGGRVRLITADGLAYTIAGGGPPSADDGNTGAPLDANMTPTAIAVSNTGLVYVADSADLVWGSQCFNCDSTFIDGHHQVRAFLLPQAAAVTGIANGATIATSTRVAVAENVPAAAGHTSLALDKRIIARGHRHLTAAVHARRLAQGPHWLVARACRHGKCVTSRPVHFHVTRVRHLTITLAKIRHRTSKYLASAVVTGPRNVRVSAATVRFTRRDHPIGKCITNARGDCTATLRAKRGSTVAATVTGTAIVTHRIARP